MEGALEKTANDYFPNPSINLTFGGEQYELRLSEDFLEDDDGVLGEYTATVNGITYPSTIVVKYDSGNNRSAPLSVNQGWGKELLALVEENLTSKNENKEEEKESFSERGQFIINPAHIMRFAKEEKLTQGTLKQIIGKLNDWQNGIEPRLLVKQTSFVVMNLRSNSIIFKVLEIKGEDLKQLIPVCKTEAVFNGANLPYKDMDRRAQEYSQIES